MALKLTYQDKHTKQMMVDSIHQIYAQHSNGAEKICTIFLKVYRNTDFISDPTIGAETTHGRGRDFHTVTCSGIDFDALVNVKPTESEIAANWTIAQILRKRAEAYIMTLDDSQCDFDYTTAVQI